MKKITTSLSETPFESIKRIDEQGEHWFARELMPLLAYAQWRQFEGVIEKAETACKNSGVEPTEHFLRATAKNENPDDKGRPGADYKLTRYACYLVAQNGDSRKPEIALAQTYFAIQTRKQELAEMEKLTKERKAIRQSASDNYKVMSTALEKARERKGKETHMHHYVNEANLVNMIALDKNTKDLQSIAGQKNFRDFLSKEALFNIDVVEAGNTWFIAQGLEYKDRKAHLSAGKEKLEQISDEKLFTPLFNPSKQIEATSQQNLIADKADDKSA